MIDRHRIIAAALGSSRLEGAEPGPESVRALERWADGNEGVEALDRIALDAARGIAPAAVPPRAA